MTAKSKEIASKSSSSQIKRYRPLIIVSDGQADARRCAQQAQFEASVREAKSRVVTITVQGWRKPDGGLWKINQLIKVKSAWLRLDEIMLIGGVSFSISDGGSITQLLLYPKNAFDILPELPDPPKPAGKTAKAKKKPKGNGKDKEPSKIGGTVMNFT